MVQVTQNNPTRDTITFNQATTEQHQSHNQTPPTLPLTGMSRANQLLPFLPFGSTTLWEWSSDGRFPAPVRLSPTCTAWRNADVHAWFKQWETDTPEPTDNDQVEGA